MIRIGAVVATKGPAGLLGTKEDQNESTNRYQPPIEEIPSPDKSAAGKITKQAGTGNFRSAPAVWVIENGKPTFVDQP